MRWLFVLAVVCGCAVSGKRVHTTHHPSGTKRWQVEMVRNQPHGESRTYHANGQLASLGTYVRGMKHGRFEYWDDEGKPIGHRYYDAGMVSRNPVAVPEERPLEPARDPLPGFATLDRTDSHTRLEATVASYRVSEELPLGALTHVGFHGQVVRGRWGGYGTVSVADVETNLGASTSVVHAPEFGGYLLVPLGGGLLVPRLGATIPADDKVDPRFAQVSGLSGFDRITDYALALPNVFVVRPAVSFVDRWRFIGFRIDVGADFLFDASTNTDVVRLEDDVEVLGRVNVGVDARYRSVSLQVELANNGQLTDSKGERFVHTAAFGVRGRYGVFQPWLAAVFPLDDELRGELWMVTVGVAYAAR